MWLTRKWMLFRLSFALLIKIFPAEVKGFYGTHQPPKVDTSLVFRKRLEQGNLPASRIHRKGQSSQSHPQISFTINQQTLSGLTCAVRSSLVPCREGHNTLQQGMFLCK